MTAMRLARVWVAVAVPISSGLKAAVTSEDAAQAASAAEAEEASIEGAILRLRAARAAEARRSKGPPWTVRGAAPVPPLSEPNSATPIVLEVSAFQDGDRCAMTLFRALSKADHPTRVSFHLLQSRNDDVPDCLGEFVKKHLPKACEPGARLADAEGVSGDACVESVLKRSHAWLLDAKDGEGPAHQRGISTSLLVYHREDSMCLSSDSHMDFEYGWDTTMLSDWASTRNEFAVLSHYPAQINTGSHGKGEYIDQCGYTLEAGIPRGNQGMNMFQHMNAPYLTVNWAAGMSFHRCHAEKKVPVDWHLRWIFTGEEIDRALRFFTNGYDLYLPTTLAVTHNYSHPNQGFFNYGGAQRFTWEKRSKDRLHQLFADGTVAEQGQRAAGASGLQRGVNFGAGHQRSVEDFVRWGRVNLGGDWSKWMSRNGIAEMRPQSSHQFCKSLQRLPVRDEVELVASIGSKPEEVSPDGSGHVKFYGDWEELEVKKVL